MAGSTKGINPLTKNTKNPTKKRNPTKKKLNKSLTENINPLTKNIEDLTQEVNYSTKNRKIPSENTKFSTQDRTNPTPNNSSLTQEVNYSTKNNTISTQDNNSSIKYTENTIKNSKSSTSTQDRANLIREANFSIKNSKVSTQDIKSSTQSSKSSNQGRVISAKTPNHSTQNIRELLQNSRNTVKDISYLTQGTQDFKLSTSDRDVDSTIQNSKTKSKIILSSVPDIDSEDKEMESLIKEIRDLFQNTENTLNTTSKHQSSTANINPSTEGIRFSTPNIELSTDFQAQNNNQTNKFLTSNVESSAEDIFNAPSNPTTKDRNCRKDRDFYFQDFEIKEQSQILSNHFQEVLGQYDTLLYRIQTVIEALDSPLTLVFNDIIDTYSTKIDNKKNAIRIIQSRIERFYKVYDIEVKLNKHYYIEKQALEMIRIATRKERDLIDEDGIIYNKTRKLIEENNLMMKQNKDIILKRLKKFLIKKNKMGKNRETKE